MISYMRKATTADIGKIVAIVNQARSYLKEQGLPQWQNGYGPSQLTIEQNVHKQEGYILISNGVVSGYAALVEGIDDYYTKIFDGQWDLEYNKYISIHSVAIDTSIRGRGLSKQLLHDLVIIARSLDYHDIRIDTHPLNIIMERAINHIGFSYKGMINFPIPDGERKAYQLLID